MRKAPQDVAALEARWDEPTSQALAHLKMIHRHDDGVVTFHRMANGRFENLFGVRAQHLSQVFQDVCPKIESDAFISLNAYWHPNTNQHYLPAAQCRQPNRLRYLCACYADLDFYKLNLTYGQVIGAVVDYQDEGIIPPVSIVVRSGRGLWLVWLLHDETNRDVAPRAWPEKLRRYKRIQQEFHCRLTHLGADAKDALRVTRVPGSIHRSTGIRVRYTVQLDGAGHRYSYSIDELATYLCITEEGPRQGISPRSVSGRSRGPRALTEYRMRDFLTLAELRGGGFDEGCRNHAAMYYAWLLKCNRVPIDQALRRVTELGTRCRPPLSHSECAGAIKSGYNRTWTSNIRKTGGHPGPPSIKFRTVADWLDITPDESKHLIKYPPAARFLQPEPAELRRSRQQARQERWAAIRKIVSENGTVPSLREMQHFLKTAGHSVSQVTVMNDFKALGLESQSAPPPRLRAL